jgi:hypothetical protein
MREYISYVLGTALLVVGATQAMAEGDDSQGSGLLGRIFRFGGSSSRHSTAPNPGGSQTSTPPLPYGSSYGNSLPAGGSTYRPSGTVSNFGGLPETPPLGGSGASGPSERLTPKPRVSAAVTNADPVLTRFALGRSNDGSAFGIFLQIFADGTVVDSEGVHHLRTADLKPILEVVQSGEVYRLHGHCGAPSTDFIEYVHLVVYERRFGRLQAHSFSYSGNPQGCDHIIRHLHQAVENLQAKLSHHPAPTAPMGPAPSALNPNPAPGVPATAGRFPAMPSTSPTGPAIPLSPADPGR